MPNLRKAQLSAQVGSFMDEPERAALIKAWATHLNATHGSIMRDIVTLGLPALCDLLTREHGALPPEIYADALETEQARGEARAAVGAAAKRAERQSIKAHRKPVKRTPRKATKTA